MLPESKTSTSKHLFFSDGWKISTISRIPAIVTLLLQHHQRILNKSRSTISVYYYYCARAWSAATPSAYHNLYGTWLPGFSTIPWQWENIRVIVEIRTHLVSWSFKSWQHLISYQDGSWLDFRVFGERPLSSLIVMQLCAVRHLDCFMNIQLYPITCLYYCAYCGSYL